MNYKSSAKLQILTVIVLLSLFSLKKGYGQQGLPVGRPGATSTKVDTSGNLPKFDSVVIVADSLKDSDSIAAADTSSSKYVISKDAIESKITFHVPDSAIIDNVSKRFQFYGVDVTVEMDDIKLQSPHIIYYQDSSTLFAYSTDDTSLHSKSTFSQGEEAFDFEEIKYNFDSKKAVVLNAKSQYDEGYIYSDKIKRNNDNTIYGLENVYTTCSAEEPHFAIISRKIKIIPERVVVSGPARLEIAGIPTPLVLPFALFPLSKGQKSGFILPTYDVSPQWGVGLRGLGYYLAISDNMDLKIQGNIYSYGTWLAAVQSSYIKRYRYGGNVNLEVGSTVSGDRNTEDYSEARTFKIGWQHRIDPNMIRGYSFNANVNLISPQFYRNTTYNNDQFLENSTNSRISLSKSWKGKPYSFNLSLQHTQNNKTHKVDLNLPTFVFNVAQTAPFKRKAGSSKQVWYEKINFAYTLNANNTASFIDTAISINDPSTYLLRNSINHYIPVNANYKVLKYLNVVFGANYREYWNTKKSFISLDDATNRRDTTTQNGFFATRSIDANIGLSNTVYGVFKFKSKYVKAIRHRLVTSVNYVMTPDFTDSQWKTYYFTKLDTADQKETAVPYYFTSLNSNYPGLGNQGTINFNLNNNFEMKIRSKKDSSGFVKSALLDQLVLNTSYNFIRDSFKLAPLTLSISTAIIKQIQLRINGNFTPYTNDSTGRLIDVYRWNADKRGLLRMRSLTIQLSGTINSKMFSPDKDERDKAVEKYLYADYLNQYVDFDIPWSLRLDFTNNITDRYILASKSWKLQQNPNTKLSGDFNLTPRWKVGYVVAYEFKTKTINYTELNLYRDLHCWEMSLGAIPYGAHRSFRATINVKASVLQDLRVNKRQDFIDNF